MPQDKIYIIGAGAIGKVLAVFLKLEGRDVVLVRGRVNKGAGGYEKIEVELGGQEVVEAEVETATLRWFERLEGTVVFTNKSFGNPALAKAVRSKTGDSPIVIMQNGLHVEQAFIDEGFTSIYRCVLFATSQPVSVHGYRFRPVAPSPIGPVNGSAAGLEAIVSSLHNHYFQFRSELDIDPIVWTKTIVNCVFNSVCPLLETDNGIFYRNEAATRIAKDIIGECVPVAAACGVVIDEATVLQTLLTISRSSEGQKISTYLDILNKRETEIGSLNLAIADIARQKGKEELVKVTGLLGALISLKSELNR